MHRYYRIRACPYCGSTDIRMSEIYGGPLTGINATDIFHHCNQCGRESVPLDFKSFEELFDFQRSLRNDGEDQENGFLHVPVMPIDTEPLFSMGRVEVTLDRAAETVRVRWEGDRLIPCDPRKPFWWYWDSISSSEYNAKHVLMMDLAGISRRRPNFSAMQELVRRRRGVWLDMGLEKEEDLLDAFTIGVEMVIAGSLTVPSLSLLEDLYALSDSCLPVLYLDGDVRWHWGRQNLEQAATDMARVGFERIGIIDLPRLGRACGPDGVLLDRASSLDVAVILGGGVRESDLGAMEKTGLAGGFVDPFTPVLTNLIERREHSEPATVPDVNARGSDARSPTTGGLPSPH